MYKWLGLVYNVLSSILGTLISVFLPVIVYNFKKENEIIREKTDRGEIIDIYGILLAMPIICLLVQLLILINRSGEFLNIILTISSFVYPILVIIILGYKIFSFCKKNLVKSDNTIIGICKKWIIYIFNIFVFLFFSVSILFIVFISYICITLKIDLWKYYIYFYLILAFSYFLIGRLMIGVYKNKYAKKVEISYFDGKKYKKLEIDYYKLKIQKDYISFYLEDNEIKYIVPLQKVYNVKIYYR
jgi:hypothetical protein